MSLVTNGSFELGRIQNNTNPSVACRTEACVFTLPGFIPVVSSRKLSTFHWHFSLLPASHPAVTLLCKRPFSPLSGLCLAATTPYHPERNDSSPAGVCTRRPQCLGTCACLPVVSSVLSSTSSIQQVLHSCQIYKEKLKKARGKF